MDAAKFKVQRVKYEDVSKTSSDPLPFNGSPATAYAVGADSVTLAPLPAGKIDRLILLEVGV